MKLDKSQLTKGIMSKYEERLFPAQSDNSEAV